MVYNSASKSFRVLLFKSGLIERVEIGPPAAGAAKGSPTIVLTGEIASMVALALEDGPRTRNAARFGPVDHDLFARSVKVVAGTHNQLDLLLATKLAVL